MRKSTAAGNTAAGDPQLEALLGAVEERLAALGAALSEGDSLRIECHSDALRAALAAAVARFTSAAHGGNAPAALRHRLALAAATVAAQREALARATAALDRTLDVLMPGDHGALYSPLGAAQRGLRSDPISA